MKTCDYEGKRNISGEQIRIERLRKHYTQKMLAIQVQVQGVILEQDAISRIESGNRMVQDYELRAIADVLGVTTDKLTRQEE